MDPVSHHGAKGIAPVEATNRHHLRSVMEDCGFISYHCEWWHYTLDHEPYPDTYFDFPITCAVGVGDMAIAGPVGHSSR